MANYVDSTFKFLGFPMGFQRDLGFALDRSEIFDSYEDAVKYASGTLVDAEKDKRKLSPTSYVGQKISVVTDNAVEVYVIDTDRSLRRLDVQAVTVDGVVIVQGDSGLTLKGSESALTGQVFGKKEDGTFGFIDQTGTGGGDTDAAIASIDVAVEGWTGDSAPYTHTINYSQHQLSRSDLIVAVYDSSTNLEINKDITWTINANGDITLSSQEKVAVKVLIAGGAATATDSEARQQLISTVTLEGNTLKLNKVDGSSITCDLSAFAPNITSSDSTLTISTSTGTVDIKLANADQYLKKTDIGTTEGKVVAVGADGKIDSSLIGDLFITDVFTVANKADLITLTNAKRGDFALVQATLNTTTDIYVLKTEPYSTLENWVQMIIPCNVLSVNGKTGTVVIGIDDISGLREAIDKVGTTLTASKIVVTDADGKIISSEVASSELAKLALIPEGFDVADYETVANKTDTIASDTSTDTKYATVAAIKTYVESRIQGHTHNGTDSQKIAFANLTGTENVATTTTVSDAVAAHNTSGDAHTVQFNAKQNKVLLVTDQTITSASWGEDVGTSGFYEYTIGNAGIKTNTKVDITPHNDSCDAILEAGILPTVISGDGSVTIFAKAKPSTDIVVDLYITEISE